MKNEEQKSAFILRVEEIEHELETLVNDKGGGEKSCILLVNETPKDSTSTQCVAIIGSGRGMVKSMAAFLSNSEMMPIAELGAKLAALEKLAKH